MTPVIAARPGATLLDHNVVVVIFHKQSLYLHALQARSGPGVWARGSINPPAGWRAGRTPTSPHQRCDMFKLFSFIIYPFPIMALASPKATIVPS